MRRALACLGLVLGFPVSAMSQEGLSLGISFGPTLPAYCAVGEAFFLTTGSINLYFCTSKETVTWTPVGSGGSLPSGAVFLITSGACPAGTTEATDLDGVFLRGTVASRKDVGTSGGSDAITPVGTNSIPTFSGSALGGHSHGIGTYDAAAGSGGTPSGTVAWPAGVPTFAGVASTSVVNHLHTLATGTGSTGNFAQVVGTVDTSSGGTGATPTQTALGTRSGNPVAGGTASYTPIGTITWPAGVPTFAGSALSNHDHALSGSSESVGAGTPAGTVTAPTFTGTEFDNRPAYTNVIFCRVT